MTDRVTAAADIIPPDPDEGVDTEVRKSDIGDALDVEIALLAAISVRDTGASTATVNLDALTPAEKQALIAVLRRTLGLGDEETGIHLEGDE